MLSNVWGLLLKVSLRSPGPGHRAQGTGSRGWTHSQVQGSWFCGPVVLAARHKRGAAAGPGVSEGPGCPYLLSVSSSGYLSTTLMMSSTTSPTHRICFSSMRPILELSAAGCRGSSRAGSYPTGLCSRFAGLPWLRLRVPSSSSTEPPAATRIAVGCRESSRALAPHVGRPKRTRERRPRGLGPGFALAGCVAQQMAMLPTSRPQFPHLSDGVNAILFKAGLGNLMNAKSKCSRKAPFPRPLLHGWLPLHTLGSVSAAQSLNRPRSCHQSQQGEAVVPSVAGAAPPRPSQSQPEAPPPPQSGRPQGARR